MTRNRALNNELAKHGLPHLRRYLRSSLPRARFGLPVVNRLQTAPPDTDSLIEPLQHLRWSRFWGIANRTGCDAQLLLRACVIARRPS